MKANSEGCNTDHLPDAPFVRTKADHSVYTKINDPETATVTSDGMPCPTARAASSPRATTHASSLGKPSEITLSGVKIIRSE